MKFFVGPEGRRPGGFAKQPAVAKSALASEPTEKKKSNSAPDNSPYMSVDEYALHRKVSVKTIRNYLHELPHSMNGGIRIRYREADEVMDRQKLSKRRPKSKRNKSGQ